MMRLRGAFTDAKVSFACTMNNAGKPFGIEHVHTLPDANRDSGMGIFHLLVATYRLVQSEKPSTIISTGALPGLLAMVWGRLRGAKCIWVESIANGEKLSGCGSIARYLCHRCYVQWPELADGRRTIYAGAVL